MFGYDAEQEDHRFEVVKRGARVEICECFGVSSILKVSIAADVFGKIAPAVTKAFNERLTKKGNFKSERTQLGRLFGKELIVLAWAVEWLDADNFMTAIDAWMRLSKEERWWLYTMAANDDNWRRSLRVSLGGAVNAPY